MTVFDLKQGQRAKITRIDLAGGARNRLQSLGFDEGREIEIIGFSLFKSSVLVSSGAVRLALRKSLAQKIGAAEIK